MHVTFAIYPHNISHDIMTHEAYNVCNIDLI